METTDFEIINEAYHENMVNALLVLIGEKTFSSISISELVERAGVSRMFFYRNYSSKEEIFERKVLTILKEYEKESEQLNDGNYCDIAHIKICFKYLEKYQIFLKGMVSAGLGYVFYEHLKAFIFDRWFLDSSDFELRCKLSAFSGMIYAVFIEWLISDSNEPISAFIQEASKICEKGL